MIELDDGREAFRLDCELQHLKHTFEGYQACVRGGGEADCPYSPGSAREVSWTEGVLLAKLDLVEMRKR